MGYDLHITRAGDWSESEDAPIARRAILRAPIEPSHVAAADPERFEGNVFTKNPDKRILAKMLVLASRLDAKVQEHDGEPYESPDDLDLSPDELFARIGDSGQTTPSDRHKRPDEPRRGSKWRWFRRR